MNDSTRLADAIVREGEKRRAQMEADHNQAILQAVQAGEPVTIWGVRYVPEDTPAR